MADRSNNAESSKAKPHWRRRAKRGCFTFLAIFLGLAAIEGTISILLFVYDAVYYTKRPLAERQHTQYDDQLGWVNVPETIAKDVYGQGRTVTINAQGFRARREFADTVPGGKTRIICIGDSFTLGYGVGDADTWCAQMEASSKDLELLNMGQGGYGFDQAYLWYMRDGFKLDHDIHLVCLNYDQLDRMFYNTFFGYGKPTLKREGNQIVPNHVPIPVRAYYVPWLTQNARLLESSRTVQLFARVFANQPRAGTVMSVEERDQLVDRAISEMASLNRTHGSRTVVVWFPTDEDCFTSRFDKVRGRTLQAARDMQIPVIDLVASFRSQPSDKLPRLFIQPDEVDVDYIGAEGHYTIEGNRFVAQRLVEELEKLGYIPAPSR